MTSAILDSLNFLETCDDYVELKNDDRFQIDLRYGSENNFMGRNLYGPFNKAYLHKIAAQKLFLALNYMKAQLPDHKFLIFDALRPRSIQRILWDEVEGTPAQQYIARPEPGSLHNFGFAVDLSILDPMGRELDMGAGYDDFRDIAQPKFEEKFLASGDLSREQWKNRLSLRSAMESAGFSQLPHEWWHFDALSKAEVKDHFKIVE